MIEWVQANVPQWVFYVLIALCVACMCASILFGRRDMDGWKE